jgi:predicted dehydrogenase
MTQNTSRLPGTLTLMGSGEMSAKMGKVHRRWPNGNNLEKRLMHAAMKSELIMVEHFADAALGGSLEFSPEESLDNMRVLDALAQAAREGSPVAVAH